MPEKYPFQEVEAKWQKIWEEQGTYRASDPGESKAEKYYGLVEFPYPSGEGLHVGHPRSYTALDIMTRKKRMEGDNVLYPMGWDAFGLPAENFAIKNKKHPAEFTAKNVANYQRQTRMLGFGFDWSREINTTNPAYYKWTQWMFSRFFNSYFDDKQQKARPIEELEIPADVQVAGEVAVREYRDARRLAYKTKITINWCPRDKIGLANEEAVGGVCDRCHGPVEKREKEQWMLRITKYADRLIDELAQVNFLDKIKTQQINWIGRSEGASVKFQVASSKSQDAAEIEVFTTRPDTLFGATYMVLSPEHELVKNLESRISNLEEVKNYQEAAAKKSDLERQENKEKTGVELKGIAAINPTTGKEIPIWIADYVLADYGTGAIMAVPAHDERDFEFAKKFGLPIVKVVQPPALDSCAGISISTKGQLDDLRLESECWSGQGIAINSGFIDGLETAKAKEKMIAWLEGQGIGERKVNYKFRDWVFSRQRYWGEPIPLVYCSKCGWVALPDSELPLELPDVANYEPTDTGDSPLASIPEWVNTKCPHCGGAARRETDTMPGWAGSSWYFMRYCDPHNDKEFAAAEKLKYWMPVDLYNGGMEHTTLHLLYSRFWYKVLFDLGFVPAECGSEPYRARVSHAMILAYAYEDKNGHLIPSDTVEERDGKFVVTETGEEATQVIAKMSKSLKNVVNPDDVVADYGADVMRMYEMFIGPYDMDAPWSTQGIIGVRRFLDKVWGIGQNGARSPKSDMKASGMTGSGLRAPSYERLLNYTIKKVGEDIDGMHFNTAVSQLMILTNELSNFAASSHVPTSQEDYEAYLKILAPFAPHLAEELWHRLGHEDSIHRSPWPKYDESKIVADTVAVAVQVNGKVRGQIEVAIDAGEQTVLDAAKNEPNVKKYLEGQNVKKAIYVKGKIVSFVV